MNLIIPAQLGYLSQSKVDTVRKVDDALSPQISKLKTDIFTGLDKLKGVKIKLHVDKNVEPVVQISCRTPFHIKRTQKSSSNLMKRGVTEKPDNQAPWVSPIVVVPQKTSGEIHICVDESRNLPYKGNKQQHTNPYKDYS